MPSPACVCRVHQLERMSEMLWGFEMLLKGCQHLFGGLGTRASTLYQAFPSSSSSRTPTAKVSTVRGKMLSCAGTPSRDGDSICGLCNDNNSAGEAHSFLPCTGWGQTPVQPFELPSTHVSAGARQKAEAEASGLFNAFSVTHCSPFLEIRPMPQSVLTAEVKPRASTVTSLHLLSERRTTPPSPLQIVLPKVSP